MEELNLFTQPGEIKKAGFLTRIDDLENQLFIFRNNAKKLPFEKIIEKLRDPAEPLLTFEEGLEKYKQTLHKDVATDKQFQEMRGNYNYIIRKLKNPETINSMEEINNLIKEADELRKIRKSII